MTNGDGAGDTVNPIAPKKLPRRKEVGAEAEAEVKQTLRTPHQARLLCARSADNKGVVLGKLTESADGKDGRTED
jgi:hypothetical protein